MPPPEERFSEQPATLEKVLADWEAERGLSVGARMAVYVSTPITTGLKFVEWLRQYGHRLDPESAEYVRRLLVQIVRPNIHGAARFVDLLCY